MPQQTLFDSAIGDRKSNLTFGNGSAQPGLEGNINCVAQNPGVSPAATGSDYVVAVYAIPANSFDAAGRMVLINAAGSFAANANTKRIKMIVNPATAVVGSVVGGGGTTICDTGSVTTNGGGWALEGSVIKYGNPGSNTQMGIHNQAQVGAAVSAMLAPSLITAVESGPILVAITANCATAVGDVVHSALQVNACN